MAGTKISELPAATLPLTGSELVPVVQGGVTYQTNASAFIRQSAPVTKTANFIVGNNENFIVCDGSASITVTLPTASSWTGRIITVKTIKAFTVVSASSNVVPLNSSTAGTAILAGTIGKWATLVSNGTNWIVMAAA
jgi:hypothetical protein